MTTTHVGQTVLCPFTVVVDTREQAPYTFTAIPATGRDRGRVWQVPTIRRGLTSGDYSIEGLENSVAVERKSLTDLYVTLGRHRERFKAEVERLAEMTFAAIVIEADQRELWRPSEYRPGWRSKLFPRSVEGTMISWSIRYSKVHWWVCGSRRGAEVRTFGVLEMFWRSASDTNL